MTGAIITGLNLTGGCEGSESHRQSPALSEHPRRSCQSGEGGRGRPALLEGAKLETEVRGRGPGQVTFLWVFVSFREKEGVKLGPSVTTRPERPPRAPQTLPAPQKELHQKAAKTARGWAGAQILRNLNLPPPHPQASWGLLGGERGARAQSHTACHQEAAYGITSLGRAQPHLGLLWVSLHSPVTVRGDAPPLRCPLGLWCS